jgi:hypothetical protein
LAVVAIGTATSSFLLPFTITLLVAVMGLAGVMIARTGALPLRATISARATRRARAARRHTRERTLAPASHDAHETFAELSKLADTVEAIAPDAAARFDLEDLLDRYAVLAVADQRARRAATMFDRAELERARDACRAAASPDPRRIDLCERRLRLQDECCRHVDAIANELALVGDLIRLIAQRAACADEITLDDRIERQLAELDDEDAARNQLADL